MEKEPHCREQEEVEDDQGDAGDQLDEDHSEPGDDDVDDDDLYIIGAVCVSETKKLTPSLICSAVEIIYNRSCVSLCSNQSPHFAAIH